MLRLKYQRLNKKGMFAYVFKQGKCIRRDMLNMQFAYPCSEGEHSRVGFVIRKTSGSAVVRNRLKRILRKAFQEVSPLFKRPAWILFTVPAGPMSVSLKEFRSTAVELLKNI